MYQNKNPSSGSGGLNRTHTFYVATADNRLRNQAGNRTLLHGNTRHLGRPERLQGHDGLTCVPQVDVTMDMSACIPTAWQRWTLDHAREWQNGTLSHAEDFQGDWGP